MKKTVLIFILGGLFGSASTRNYFKKKYEKIAKEDIDSVKETFSKFSKNPEEDDASADKINKKEKEDYKNILDKVNYSGYFEPEKKKEVEPVDGPYVISPEEFGEFDDYEELCWTYYDDKHLADENDDLVDDIEGTVGYESLRMTCFSDLLPSSCCSPLSRCSPDWWRFSSRPRGRETRLRAWCCR